MKLKYLLLLVIPLALIGCERQSNEDTLGSPNTPPSSSTMSNAPSASSNAAPASPATKP